jgi:hypothetical protein
VIVQCVWTGIDIEILAVMCSRSESHLGWIPDGVIGIFLWRNLSGRTIALGSTQSLNINEYQIISLGVKAAGM